jgi:hypothetical protein
MLLYFLLDTSTSIILWLIKYLGYGIYYSISYLFYSNNLTAEEEENKNTLELLIQQQADIETIKKYIENMEKQKKD